MAVTPKSELGAAMVETALTVLVFLLFILFCIDLARVFYVYSVINYAAHRAVDQAVKLEADLDVSQQACAASPRNCPTYSQILATVQSEANRIARLAACPADQNCLVSLRQFAQYRLADYSYETQAGLNCSPNFCSAAGQVFEGLLLRPGESGWRLRNGNDEVRFAHPTRPPLTGPRPTANPPGPFNIGWPWPAETWSSILADHPVVFRVEVDFRFITPFLGSRVLSGVQASFRRTTSVTAPAPLLPQNPGIPGGGSTSSSSSAPPPPPVCDGDCSPTGPCRRDGGGECPDRCANVSCDSRCPICEVE